MAKVVDGKFLRNKILGRLKADIAKKRLQPKLAIILVGEDEASLRYIKQKIKVGEEIGVEVGLFQFPATISQEEVRGKIEQLNQDPTVKGIVVQLPLPPSLNKDELVQLVKKDKDADGLVEGSSFTPATPLAVMQILKEEKVEVRGKTAVVIGRSRLVGAPVKFLLEKNGARVLQIHSQTPPPIDSLVQQGDIVVSAVGKPHLVKKEMVKKGAVVIDVGISKNPDTGKLTGDVDFEKVKEVASVITPVPGGVGPLTVAMLMNNLVKASQN